MDLIVFIKTSAVSPNQSSTPIKAGGVSRKASELTPSFPGQATYSGPCSTDFSGSVQHPSLPQVTARKHAEQPAAPALHAARRIPARIRERQQLAAERRAPSRRIGCTVLSFRASGRKHKANRRMKSAQLFRRSEHRCINNRRQ